MQKIMCAHAHHEHQAEASLRPTAGVQARRSGKGPSLEALGVLMLSRDI